MKLLISLSYLLPVAFFYCPVTVLSVTNYSDIATNLTNEITVVLYMIKTLNFNLDYRTGQIEKADLGLGERPSIVELKVKMENKARKKGFTDCQKLFNKSLKNLEYKVKDIIMNSLATKKYDLTVITATLMDIRDKIKGENLNAVIRQCERSPKICSLTNYASQVASNKRKVQDTVDLFAAPDLLSRIMYRNRDLIRYSITTIMLKPVGDCVQNLH